MLNAKGFKTTQYIPTLGLVPTRTVPDDADEIRTTAAQGHEIGSHSITHPDLTTVSDTQPCRTELVASKSLLENAIGMPVVNFAYPFGAYDARVIAAMKAAGYRSGRSVEEGYNTKLDLEPYDIHVQNM